MSGTCGRTVFEHDKGEYAPAIGAKGKVKFVVKNQSNVKAKGKIDIDIYLSADPNLDGGNTPLTTATNKTINLKQGKSTSFTINVTLPPGLTPGDYYFLANVDSADAIDESNEGNNLAATTNALTIQ
jgi:hypothetical protein